MIICLSIYIYDPYALVFIYTFFNSNKIYIYDRYALVFTYMVEAAWVQRLRDTMDEECANSTYTLYMLGLFNPWIDQNISNKLFITFRS